MARILIIGGHGKVARLLTPLLVDRGDDVSAVIRNPDHSADVEKDGARAVLADVAALDRDGLAALCTGQDAVVWAAGAGGGDPDRTYAIDRDAAIRSMDAAQQAGPARYVMVSYFGAGEDHGVPPGNSFFAYAEAKSAADAHLRNSSLEWTILRPSGLTLDPPTGGIDVGGDESRTVPRADVAAVIAAVLAEPSTARRTIEFNAGSTPIAEAVRA
ncbi:MAG TPA: NAD-dependent dehydratase [Microbacterium sp.]|nr:NAD-dependent dehydratase [Microbacterium sp.]